jgi:hypothetical protein
MAHCNTIFHQMLKLIPRHHFDKLEAEHGTSRKARSFTCWSQLVHLLSMPLTARASLREGIASLKSRRTNLYHLGIKPVARSTFGGQNHRRHLQRTLADRDFLPFLQAESEDQGLHRQHRERRPDPDLCGPHRLSFALLHQVPL